MGTRQGLRHSRLQTSPKANVADDDDNDGDDDGDVGDVGDVGNVGNVGDVGDDSDGDGSGCLQHRTALDLPQGHFCSASSDHPHD